MPSGVPGFISNIDGIHGILFHVEHSGETEWFHRWRLTGPVPPPYAVWREATCRENIVRLASEIAGAEIEVQWRPSPEDEWRQAALLELLTPRAVFSFLPESGFMATEPFTVCAPVRGDGVAAYHFPAITVEAGFEARVMAEADAPAWPNVLLAPGEFQPLVAGITISNEGPSSGAWRESPHEGPFTLTRCPIASARRWFAYGRESVNPVLLESIGPIGPISP